MRITRILIIDDLATSRNLLRKMLTVDANLEIVGSVSDCKIALSKIPQVNPDIVMLDVNMPNTDVIQTLLEIRKTHPALPVLMLCMQKHNKNAAKVLEALAAGANDFIPRSDKVTAETEARELFRKQLFQKLKPFCRGPFKKKSSEDIETTDPEPSASVKRNVTTEVKAKFHENPASPYKKKEVGTDRIDILAIGVSTGGPQALDKILPLLSANFPIPIVIVQHMPSDFTSLLAERLNTRSSIEIKEGQKGDVLRPGQAYLAAGGKHMVIQPSGNGFQINTHMGPPENSCRPAVDVLFRSIADCYGNNTLAVILTGMGQDGLRGCEAIRESGGTIFIQDENSSVVWGMPGSLARAGLANKVLPLDTMATAVEKRVWQGRSTHSSTPYYKNQQSIAT
jgi:two-component system, chemotaxis family, protein-glutamate methylesterase/glutaminase